MNICDSEMEARTRDAETNLLQQAIEKFADTTGIQIDIVEHGYPIAPGRWIDALARIDAGIDVHTYAIEIKRYLNKAIVGQAAEQLKMAPHKGMLVTDYVNPQMAERLKKMEIAFIDLAGNAYLNEPPVFVFIKGNKQPGRWDFGKELAPRRAFQATGLKVVFGILTNPGLLNKNYRTIADATGVALGTVGWVLTDLREHGYLIDRPKNERRLVQRRKLVDQWVAAYPEKLRPKLKLGRFQAETPIWWEKTDIGKYDALWGGEIAAAKLTKYLKPQNVTIYTQKIDPQLILEKHLKKNPEGGVEILEQFWTPQLNDEEQAYFAGPDDLVPPLLVYADLIATAEGRNIETAKRVFDEYLDRYLEEH